MPTGATQIFAGKLFDPYTLALLENQLITVCPASGLVTDVRPFSAADADAAARDFAAARALDLRGATVLPGLVDVHVHLFLHPYAETSWEDQLTKESTVERTVRATLHARRTLMAGYTAVRDLGTEGAGDADLHLRSCLSGPRALVPGPRYFCANRALVVTGSYGPKSRIALSAEGVEGVTGAAVADGAAECVKAVRRQVGAGADWIKIYADYRFRSRMADVSARTAAADIATFNKAELEAITQTAHSLGVKVAAHAAHWHARGTNGLLDGVGVHSIEHGYDMILDDDDAVDASLASHAGTTWVPTLAAYYTMSQGGGGRQAVWARAQQSFQRALACGMDNIACGGDTGVFPHGDNALEMKLMVRLGADWRRVLRWSTLGGWECIRGLAWEGTAGAERLARVAELENDAPSVGDNDVAFGAVRRGFAADIIATNGDLAGDFENAVDKAAIVFVMKGGKVYKREGRELV